MPEFAMSWSRRVALLVLGLIAGLARADTVQFSLRAPQAKQVFLAGEMIGWDNGKKQMSRDADGVWRLSMALAPGQWIYKFVVDGRWVHDPATTEHDADGRGGQHAFVFVGEGPWTAPAAALSGRVETHTVQSSALRRGMKVHVYLPRGYKKGQALPVLWLLHGSGMDADQWFKTGHIERYLDRLMAAGRVKPFAVVMPSAGTQRAYEGGSERFVATELPAWLAKHYNLRPGRAQSALAGMSLGGYGTVALAARHRDQYGFGYALSGWYPPELIAELRAAPPLDSPFVLRCGSEDDLVASNRALVAALQTHGTPIEYVETTGGHTFQLWSNQIEAMLLAVDGFFVNR
jgi:enterochelin esterase-like enzyme